MKYTIIATDDHPNEFKILDAFETIEEAKECMQRLIREFMNSISPTEVDFGKFVFRLNNTDNTEIFKTFPSVLYQWVNPNRASKKMIFAIVKNSTI
jgi:hypothetical protein